jgi:hypothetical protein
MREQHLDQLLELLITKLLVSVPHADDDATRQAAAGTELRPPRQESDWSIWQDIAVISKAHIAALFPDRLLRQRSITPDVSVSPSA